MELQYLTLSNKPTSPTTKSASIYPFIRLSEATSHSTETTTERRDIRCQLVRHNPWAYAPLGLRSRDRHGSDTARHDTRDTELAADCPAAGRPRLPGRRRADRGSVIHPSYPGRKHPPPPPPLLITRRHPPCKVSRPMAPTESHQVWKIRGVLSSTLIFLLRSNVLNWWVC